VLYNNSNHYNAIILTDSQGDKATNKATSKTQPRKTKRTKQENPQNSKPTTTISENPQQQEGTEITCSTVKHKTGIKKKEQGPHQELCETAKYVRVLRLPSQNT
jgi:hypothetical protein